MVIKEQTINHIRRMPLLELVVYVHCKSLSQHILVDLWAPRESGSPFIQHCSLIQDTLHSFIYYITKRHCSLL